MKNIGWIAFVSAVGLTVAQPVFAQSTGNAEIVVSAEHQRDWNRGQEMERDGIDRLARADRRMRDARRTIERGDSRQADARRRLESARTEYRQLAGSLDAGADSANALRHSRAMKTAAERWVSAEERLDDGNNMLRDGRRALSRAENQRDEAQGRIDEGLAMKARAERASAMQTAGRS